MDREWMKGYDPVYVKDREDDDKTSVAKAAAGYLKDRDQCLGPNLPSSERR